MSKKVLCIIGTRPEVIKMAPVVRLLRTVPYLDVNVLSSGQHRELLIPLLRWFEINVDADLDVMTANQSLSELTARLMRGLDQQFSASRPDLVLAQGDTTTVLCAALSCFYMNIPFAHVEADGGIPTGKRQAILPRHFLTLRGNVIAPITGIVR